MSNISEINYKFIRINTFLGPSNIILFDTVKQFIAKEFKQYVINMGIIIKNIPIEAHHFIRLIKCYHGSFHQIYRIITAKISGIKPEL